MGRVHNFWHERVSRVNYHFLLPLPHITACLSPCERCFGKNTTCTQCLKYRVLDSYHEAEEFEEIPHDCDFHPELEKFTCSEECTIAGHEPNEELNHTCFGQ